MEKIDTKEFMAMADELVPVETLDKGKTIYTKTTENGIAFYISYTNDLEWQKDISYYYLFTISKENLTIGNINNFYKKMVSEEKQCH